MNLLYSLKMILRSWLRSPLSTAISLVSLTVGLACSTVLIMYVLGEYRIAQALGNPQNTYMVKNLEVPDNNRQEGHMTSKIRVSMVPMLAERYPEVEQGLLWLERSQIRWENDEDKNFNAMPYVYAVGPGLTNFFDLPVEEGDLAQTLAHPDQVAVTREFASLYFGDDQDPMGRQISGGESFWKGNNREKEEFHFTVTTILKNSRDLPLAYSGLFAAPEKQISSTSGNFTTNYGFLRLREGVDPEAFLAKVHADSVFFARDSLALAPIDQLYFQPEQMKIFNFKSLVRTQDASLLTIGIAIALAVLIIACFNYINITMTRSARRLKNMAGQRIMGASKWNVRGQVLLDTTLQVVLGFVLALVIIDAILPFFNEFMSSHMDMRDMFTGANPWVLLGVLVSVAILSSLFVAVKLESSSVLLSFKAPSAGKMTFTRTMVIAQFVASVVLVSVALNITRQMSYITHTVPGAERMLSILASGREALPAEYIEGIKNLAFVDTYIYSDMKPNMMMQITGERGEGQQIVFFAQAEAQYFDYYDMPVIEGRVFTESDNEQVAVVNHAYVKSRGWETPIGESVPAPFSAGGGETTIIGVVDDRVMGSARERTLPMVVSHSKNAYGRGWSFFIKTHDEAANHIEDLTTLWKETAGEQPLPEFKTMVDIYREANKGDEHMRKIITFFAGLSILLTALGLFGLAWYAVERRKKEIALRKVHGSRVSQVIDLLCRSFFSWMAVAVVIALPVAWWLTAEWLKDFVYKAPIAWWTFAATALIAAVVTLLTVIFQSWRAATANPVKAIHAE